MRRYRCVQSLQGTTERGSWEVTAGWPGSKCHFSLPGPAAASLSGERKTLSIETGAAAVLLTVLRLKAFPPRSLHLHRVR